jgi:dTDP-glucose 4,6-dehydratase
MNVLITGGAGFIGSNLARYWTQRHPNDRVVVLDALTYAGHRESLAGLPVRFVHGDVTRPDDVRNALEGVDLVLHLAAETHNDRAIGGPMTAVQTNVVGTATLLEGCRKLDVKRLHHVSTDEVYGSLALDTPEVFTVDSPYRPRGPYSASKAGADHLVRAWHETYGLAVTISSCSNNFGPYQHPEKLVPLAITHLLNGQKVPIYGNGQNVRDWIYVTDHCEAIDMIARHGRIGDTYLVSAQQQLSNLAMVRRLLGLLGADEGAIEFVADRPGHDLRYALDPTKIVTELHWAPRHDFETALRETVEWYRGHPEWWRPLV